MIQNTQKYVLELDKR